MRQVRRTALLLLLVFLLAHPVTAQSSSGKITFVSALNGKDSGPNAIFLINADGTGLTQLTYPPEATSDNDPVWSPDGERIAFARNGSYPGTGEVFVINSDGTGLEQLTTELYTSLAWSPDGQFLAMARYTVNSTTLHLMDLETRSIRLLYTPVDGETLERLDHLSWSKDGSSLVFISYRDDNTVTPSFYMGIFRLDLETGKVDLIHRCESFCHGATVSPDGQHIAYIQIGDRVMDSLWLVTYDGQNARQVTTGEFLDNHPAWSPDSKHIIFTRFDESPLGFTLYILDLASGEVRRLDGLAGYDSEPAWQPVLIEPF
jgi:Tol biopolymer transport system component